jgi:hypothetical protein
MFPCLGILESGTKLKIHWPERETYEMQENDIEQGHPWTDETKSYCLQVKHTTWLMIS